MRASSRTRASSVRGTRRPEDAENFRPDERRPRPEGREFVTQPNADRDARHSFVKRRVSLERAFREITNQPGGKGGGGTAGGGGGRASSHDAKPSKEIVGRAYALLSDPRGFGDAITEVETWAAALNERNERDEFDAYREEETTEADAGVDEYDDDATDDDETDAIDVGFPHTKSQRTESELKKMRQVLEISSQVRDVCDARGFALELATQEIAHLKKERQNAELQRDLARSALGEQSRAIDKLKTETQRALELKSKQLEHANTEASVSTGVLKAKNSDLTEQLTAVTTDRSRVQNALRDAEMELQALSIEHDGNAGASEAAIHAIEAAAAFETDNEVLKGKLRAKQGEFVQLTGELSGLKTQVTDLQTQIATTNSALQVANANLILTKAHAAGAFDKNDVLTDELFAARNELSGLRNKLTASVPPTCEKTSESPGENIVISVNVTEDSGTLRIALESSERQCCFLEKKVGEQMGMIASQWESVETERKRSLENELSATETKRELAARRLGAEAAERHGKGLEAKIERLELELRSSLSSCDTQSKAWTEQHAAFTLEFAKVCGELEKVRGERDQARGELRKSNATLVSANVSREAVVKEHLASLHAMELQVETAKEAACIAERSACDATTSATQSAEKCAQLFTETERARMDFRDARDEAERLACELGDSRRVNGELTFKMACLESVFPSSAPQSPPVTLRITVVDRANAEHDEQRVERIVAEGTCWGFPNSRTTVLPLTLVTVQTDYGDCLSIHRTIHAQHNTDTFLAKRNSD